MAASITGESAIELIPEAPGNYWGNLYDSANRIYGFGMIRLLEKRCQSNRDHRKQNGAIQIDDKNASEPIIKNNARPTVIVAATHLIWRRIHALSITSLSEWAHGARNITDLPTRNVALRIVRKQTKSIGDLRDIYEAVSRETRALETGMPIGIPPTLGSRTVTHWGNYEGGRASRIWPIATF